MYEVLCDPVRVEWRIRSVGDNRREREILIVSSIVTLDLSMAVVRSSSSAPPPALEHPGLQLERYRLPDR